MSRPFVAHWGILGCGWMSSMFVKDLCVASSTRQAGDVGHAIAAVGSRIKEKAEEFIQTNCPHGAAAQIDGTVAWQPKPYGSYKHVVEDSNVNIVYVGTMNIAHFDDAKLALEAGKHCLLEKPATLNAAEWRVLAELAKRKGVFLMEAVWTRFNPVLIAVQQAVHSGVIGEIRCLYSDLSMRSLDTNPPNHRTLIPELAGGALLDLGPYPLVWALMIQYHHPANRLARPSKVGSTMLLRKGVDIATSFTLTFENLGAVAYCTANLVSATDETCGTRIVGSKGEIIVTGITSRPDGYVVKRYADPNSAALHAAEDRFLPDEKHSFAFEGVGWNWEADAVARCLRDGLLECPRMPHAETEMTMEMFDQIRVEGGYTYLPGLEKVQL